MIKWKLFIPSSYRILSLPNTLLNGQSFNFRLLDNIPYKGYFFTGVLKSNIYLLKQVKQQDVINIYYYCINFTRCQ